MRPSDSGPERASSTPGNEPGRMRSRRWTALSLALALLGASVLGYAVTRPPAATPSPPAPPPGNEPSPGTLELLAQGTARIYLPVMTLYVPSAIPDNVTFLVRASIGGSYSGESANLSYDWVNVTGSPLPVQFAFGPESGAFRVGSMGGFILAPGLRCANCGYATYTQELTAPNERTTSTMSGMLYLSELNYSVFRITPISPSNAGPYLRVVYHFVESESYFQGLLLPVPTVFFGPPAPSELLPVGEAVYTRVGLQMSNDRFDVHDLALPVSTFRQTLPPVRFEAGPLGNFSARLVSSFRWNAGGDYSLMIGSPQWSRTISFWLQLYVDARFGSLYPVVLP